ncbi:hypothetical protein HY733_02465 [Candidatus Uhrbacteria bacterium]|nr:hypothetical protein [Candidatus Uhrbacteria bacterium]
MSFVIHSFQVLFAVPSDTISYSEVGIGDVERATPLSEYKAIWFHDKLVVPMLGVKPMQDAFFFWQRFWTQENLDKLLAEIRKVVEDGRDDVVVFFLDLEAPIVGSHNGLDIWGSLFAAICASGLAEHFIGFKEAAEVWKHQAVRPEGPTWTLFASNLGLKWTGLQPQLDHTDRTMAARAPRTDGDHRLLGQATTSDVLSAWNSKLRGPINITADEGPIRISYDQGVIDIATRALKAYEERRPFRELISDIQDENVFWFANRIADAIER